MHLIQSASSLPADASALESAIDALEKAVIALEKSSGCWEGLLPWFGAMVVVGVAAEIWVILREHREAMGAWQRGIIRPPDKPLASTLWLALIATILVTLGVFGEFAVGVVIANINGELRTKNADLRNKSGQLIALIGERAAKLEKEAEEIRASVAPRRLTKKQQLAIEAHLSRFSGQPVTAVHNTFDIEAAVFAAEIVSTLKLAKWTMSTVGVSGPLFRWAKAPSVTVTGIFIEAATDKRSQLAARALSQELSSNGFNCRIRKRGLIGNWEKPPVVLIDVEPRPEGPQGEAILRAEATKKRQQASSQVTLP